jgi:hypothetical protein
VDEATHYNQAKERVEALKGFCAHLAVYVAVNTGSSC